MASNRSIIYVGNTSTFDVNGLKDVSGNYVNNATVTISALTKVGSTTTVGGVSPPITCAYRAGTNGNYRGTIPSSAAFAAGQVYEATVLVVAATGERGTWQERIRAKVRRD